MLDVSGSRFLRMAGSDGFQRELNRSAQPAGTRSSSLSGGDLSIQPVPGSGAGRSIGGSGSFDYSMLGNQPDTNKPSSIQGPGSFGRQVEREKYLEDNNIAQGKDSTWEFAQRGLDFLKDNPTDDEGSNIAMKYIRNAAITNPIDIEKLDHSIRMRPLYHEAKSKLEGLRTFGDVARWSREALPDYAMPDPMEAVKTPDFKGIYKDIKKDIDKIDID